MTLTIIAAMSENRVIGRDGGLPWHLPADLRRFEARTRGHPVIMGRRTFESIGSRPLPGRATIVVSRSLADAGPGVRLAGDFDEAVGLAGVPGGDADGAAAERGGGREVFVAGGAAIYALALPRADRLDLTIVHAEVDGDTRFPAFDSGDWALASEERHEADDRHAYAFSFRTYERRAGC